MKLGFAGTPEFAAEALRALLAVGYPPAVVMTQPDRPAGRGMRLQASPVKLLTPSGTPILQPQGLRLDGKYAEEAHAAQATLSALELDVLVVAAYGLILPRWLLDLPRWGCVNIHASLLPRWRGAAPIHRAIEAGDAETGVTIMQMEEGLDTGPMLLAERLPISHLDTTQTLHDRLAPLGGRLMVEALELLACGGLVPIAQPDKGITYAHKLLRTESKLDWAQPAVVLDRKIRAFSGFPGTHFECDQGSVKVHQAELLPDQPVPAPCGQIVAINAQGVTVACGQGRLRLQTLQRPSSTRQAADVVARACGWDVGQRFWVG